MKYLIIVIIFIVGCSIFVYSMGKLKKDKSPADANEKELNEIEKIILKLNENINLSNFDILAQYLDELYKDKPDFVAEMIKKSNIVESWKETIRIDNNEAYLNYYNPDESYFYQINLIKIDDTWKIKNIDILR